MARKKKKRVRADPAAMSEGGGFDLTPMIDVVFLLIIFFMIVTDIANRKPQLQLPVAKKAEPDKLEDRQRLVININADGSIVTVQGKLDDVALDRLLAAEAMVSRGGMGAETLPSRAVIIRADRETQYGEVQKVMYKCMMQKLWRIAFATKDELKKK